MVSLLDALLGLLGLFSGMSLALFFLCLKKEKKKIKLPKIKKRGRHDKKAILKDRIYSKEDSWSRFNCELDGVDHNEYVKKMMHTQDDSYHYLKKQKEKK